MKKINENQKVTLTVGQLKRLVKEAEEEKKVEPWRVNKFLEAVLKDSEYTDNLKMFVEHDCIFRRGDDETNSDIRKIFNKDCTFYGMEIYPYVDRYHQAALQIVLDVKLREQEPRVFGTMHREIKIHMNEAGEYEGVRDHDPVTRPLLTHDTEIKEFFVGGEQALKKIHEMLRKLHDIAYQMALEDLENEKKAAAAPPPANRREAAFRRFAAANPRYKGGFLRDCFSDEASEVFGGYYPAKRASVDDTRWDRICPEGKK